MTAKNATHRADRITRADYISPQQVAAELGVPHRLRSTDQVWSWAGLEDAACVLYWERRPDPRGVVRVAS